MKNDYERKDEEIFMLIELWSSKEELYNVKNPRYQNRDHRNRALESILTSLQNDGVAVTSMKQIQDKINNLRNYYAAERRKTESSQRSGAGTDNLYKSSRKFFAQLQFLQDGFTPRQTVSNLDDRTDAEEPFTYYVTNPPSVKSARKIKERQRENAEKVMQSAALALEKISNRQERREIDRPGNSEDRCYADMILQMQSSIPDSEAKAMAKLEFQQKLIQLRYRQVQQQQQPQQMFQPYQVFQQQRVYPTQLQGQGVEGFYSGPSERGTPSPAQSNYSF